MLVDIKPEQIRVPFSIVVDGAVVFNDAFMLTAAEYEQYSQADLNVLAQERYAIAKAALEAASSDPGQEVSVDDAP